MLISSLLLQADSLKLGLPDRSVHTICTSSPYWSLRDYKLSPTAWPAVPDFRPLPELDPAVFPGCDPDCDHEWGALQRVCLRGKVGDKTTVGQPEGGRLQKASTGRWCQKCGGWLGCLGQEPTPAMFTAHLVALSREFWRVLRDDGTYWLNLGDSYCSTPRGNRSDGVETSSLTNPRRQAGIVRNGRPGTPPGLRQKDLVGIPWRVAFALQADGWYLRICNVWAKGRDGEVGDDGYGCSMPMSRTDAPTISHESVFLLTKKPRYYYDAEAVRVHWIDWSEKNPARRKKSHNLRSVWVLPPEPFAGAHFAVFPTGLPELCLRASVSERGVCPECGAPWKRAVERTVSDSPSGHRGSSFFLGKTGSQQGERVGRGPRTSALVTVGWVPGCECYGKPSRGPVTCSKCRGSGKKRVYPRGNQEWNAGAVATGGQPQRDTKGGVTNCPAVEIDEPCPHCAGSGTAIGGLWPGNVDDWPTSPSIILDPFCGSARTGAACRRIPGPASFIGTDLSGPYLREHAAATLATRSVEMGDCVKERKGVKELSDLPLFSLGEQE